jgi:hypothetical protein
MATTKTTASATPAPTTAKWNGAEAEVLAGVDLKDKAELVDVPFLMTGIKNTVNTERGGILYAWIEGETEDGERFTFNDSGKGIRAQVDTYLDGKGKAGVMDEWIDCNVVAPKGLRVSRFETKDERGRDVQAKTYYITTSGVRA